MYKKYKIKQKELRDREVKIVSMNVMYKMKGVKRGKRNKIKKLKYRNRRATHGGRKKEYEQGRRYGRERKKKGGPGRV
jgi:hypothetical protein